MYTILDNDNAQLLLAYVGTTFRYLSVYFLLTYFVVKQYAVTRDSSFEHLALLSRWHRFLSRLI